MNWRKLDQGMNEIVARRAVATRPAAGGPPSLRHSSDDDRAAVALELIAQVAAAIGQMEEQAAEAVARTRSFADAMVEKLETASARAERAEKAQREAEARIGELDAAIAATTNDMEALRNRLAAKEAELAETQQRAERAEWRALEAKRRADEAEASIARIVGAIREQLPAMPGSADGGRTGGAGRSG